MVVFRLIYYVNANAGYLDILLVLQAFKVLLAISRFPFRFLSSWTVVFLANVNSRSRSRSLYAIARPSVVCLSSVCNVRAPYSGG